MPDGSTVVLIQRPGRPLVTWASFVEMGRQHDPVGLAGLSEACLLASLNGTFKYGSKNADAERTALIELDRARERLRRAKAREAGAELLTELTRAVDDAEKAARALADPFAFRRMLATLPVHGPRIETDVDGSVLVAQVPAGRLLDFAVYMQDRRRSAVLRDFHELFARTRAALRERARTSDQDASSYLRRACARAIVVHPRRIALLPPAYDRPALSWAEARTFYLSHQQPERTVTVLVGNFPLARTVDGLKRVFVEPAQEGLPIVRDPAPEPEQAGRNTTFLDADGAPRFVLAYRIPPDTPDGVLGVVGEMVAGSDQSLFTGKLVRETGLATHVGVHSRFPGLGDPSLFTIEVIGRPDTYEKLLTDTLALTRDLRDPDRGAIERAIRKWRADERRLAEDPERLAIRLARRVGLHGTGVLTEGPPTIDSVSDLVAKLFVDRRLTLVRSLPDQGGPSQKDGGR